MASVSPIAGDPIFFSARTPEPAGRLLQAAEQTADPHHRERLLHQAVEQYPSALDARIALYKFRFRGGRHREAEQAVWGAMREAARQGGFDRNYRRLTPTSTDWLDDRSISRLYLFSLKALGVIRLRRGRTYLARIVLTKLLELDPQDELGGGHFLAIARSFEAEHGAD